MKVRLSSEIRKYFTVWRDKAWEFFLAFMGPRALSSWRACKACRWARSALATAALRACASWNSFSCSALALASSAALFFSANLCGHQNFTAPSSTLPRDPLIDFHTAANFSSWARFFASAARFLSLLVYLPASHRVASMASRDFSRTRTARDKSPGSAAPRGRSGRSPRERASAAVRASSSREPSLRNNSAARTCVEINQ